MPLPERYQIAVPEVAQLWEPGGSFLAQARVWEAQCEARHELEGNPTAEGLELIRQALKLSAEDLEYLNQPKGHETVRFQRLIQARLPKELGNKIHEGNTSRDVLDTSLSLQFLESLKMVREDFELLSQGLLSLSFQYKETLQIGRTHGQHAVPQTFGRQVLGWYAEIDRGLYRIAIAEEVIAFGKCSGEVGTNIFISPEIEERSLAKLGLKPEPAPTQMVSRDRHAEVVSLMAVNGAGLARFAINIGNLARTEIGELSEPFDEHGSSAMPHKKNSELSERIRALNERIKSTPGEVLNIAVYYEEGDMTNSAIERFTYPDLFGCLVYAGKLANIIVTGLTVNTEKMAENLGITQGAIYSSRLLNELLATGKMSRSEAYDLVKKLSHQALTQKVHLLELADKNEQISALILPGKLEMLFDPGFYLRNIDIAYKRLGVLSD